MGLRKVTTDLEKNLCLYFCFQIGSKYGAWILYLFKENKVTLGKKKNSTKILLD